MKKKKKKIQKILLINTSSIKAYEKSKVKGVIPNLLPLNIATIATPLLKNSKVEVIDLNIEQNEDKVIEQKISDFEPDYVGISCTTPIIYRADEISRLVKEYDKRIITVLGGPHASIYPKATLRETSFDICVIGEGDFVLKDIINDKLATVSGIAYKHKGKIHLNKQRPLIRNLDSLPIPAWNELFDIKKYKISKLISKKDRVAPLETSRGCVYGCTYCSKSIFGRTFRFKSAERVVKEIEYLEKCGFEEFHVVDDMFTTLIDRATKICDLIIKKKINLVFNLRNGIRVDRINEDLMSKMKQAGCYRISFGVESGNQKVLNDINKGIKLEQVRRAFKLAKKFNIETLGFFMLGLPTDTEETMRDTINFAKELNPTIAKASICTPFPGTALFNEFNKKDLIKTKDWRKYLTHSPEEVYIHPQLDWNIIHLYYNKFYKEFYLRPSFMVNKFKETLSNGTLIPYIKTFLKTKW